MIMNVLLNSNSSSSSTLSQPSPLIPFVKSIDKTSIMVIPYISIKDEIALHSNLKLSNARRGKAAHLAPKYHFLRCPMNFLRTCRKSPWCPSSTVSSLKVVLCLLKYTPPINFFSLFKQHGILIADLF